MTHEKTAHEAAEAYYCGGNFTIKHDRIEGPMVRASAILNAFKAGAQWQSEQPGRLVPRGAPEHVPLTEIAGGIIAAREDIATRSFDLGVRISDTHADVRCIKSMLQGLAEAIGSHHKMTTGALVETQGIIQKASCNLGQELERIILDVGEKVEAVLDQVTPHDVGPYDAQVGKDFNEAALKQALSAIGRATSEPVTDESGVSVGAGTFVLDRGREECLLRRDHDTIVTQDSHIRRLQAERDKLQKECNTLWEQAAKDRSEVENLKRKMQDLILNG